MSEKLDVREACVCEALSIISKSGIESLSLREVSRRLKVSHQAPYKHFQSRDHILAEVISRAFADFAEHLESSLLASPQIRDSDRNGSLYLIGQAYLNYALVKPLQYRLMFLTSLPDLELHPELAEKASVVFSILRRVIKQIKMDADDAEVTREALFAWSTVHGLASIMQFNSLPALGIEGPSEQRTAIQHIMNHICHAMGSNESAVVSPLAN